MPVKRVNVYFVSLTPFKHIFKTAVGSCKCYVGFNTFLGYLIPSRAGSNYVIVIDYAKIVIVIESGSPYVAVIVIDYLL